MGQLSRDVLVVEDEFLIADTLTQMLTELGLTVCGVADTAEEAISLARQHLPGLVLMDVRLKGTTDGIEAALAIRASVGSAIIFVTGSQEPETIHRMVQDPSFSVLFKPFRFHQLRDAVHRILPP